MAEAKRHHVTQKDDVIEIADPAPLFPFLPTGPLITILTLPIQALAILLLSKFIQQFVLCINEVYEVTGRRARSKFTALPWLRIAVGVVFLGVYHGALARLVIMSYRSLRRGSPG